VTTTSRAPRPTAWRNAVFVAFALNGFGISAWVARIPSVRDHLRISVAEVGILIFGLSVGAVLGLILAGHIVHWLGGRQSIRVSLIVAGVALAGVGFGTTVLSSFGIVLASLVIYGFCSSICDVAMNVEGAAVERTTGRTIMPLFHASWSLGTVAGAGIGSAAAFNGIDPVWHLGAVGVLLIVAVPIVAAFIPADDHLDEGDIPAAPLTFRDRMAIWLEPRTLLIGLIVLGMAFTEGSANDWLALAMVDGLQLEHRCRDRRQARRFGLEARALVGSRARLFRLSVARELLLLGALQGVEQQAQVWPPAEGSRGSGTTGLGSPRGARPCSMRSSSRCSAGSGGRVSLKNASLGR